MPKTLPPKPATKKEFRAQTTVAGAVHAALCYHAAKAIPPASIAAITRHALTDWANRNPAPANYTPPAQES